MIGKHRHIKFNPSCFVCSKKLTKDDAGISVRGRSCKEPQYAWTIWFCSAKCAAVHAAYILGDIKEARHARNR